MRLCERLKESGATLVPTVLTKFLLYLLLILLLYCGIFIRWTNPSEPSLSFLSSKKYFTSQLELDNAIETFSEYKDYVVRGNRSSWSSPYTYICMDDHCERMNKFQRHDPHVPIEVCWLTCGKYGALWPYPTGKVSL